MAYRELKRRTHVWGSSLSGQLAERPSEVCEGGANRPEPKRLPAPPRLARTDFLFLLKGPLNQAVSLICLKPAHEHISYHEEVSHL